MVTVHHPMDQCDDTCGHRTLQQEEVPMITKSEWAEFSLRLRHLKERAEAAVAEGERPEECEKFRHDMLKFCSEWMERMEG